MDRAPEDSASADATLRCFAPRCLREPYLRALAAPGGPSELLGRRLHFAEVAARYLTALLAADPGARARPPDGLLALVATLERPSFGDWATAADALARAVALDAGPLAAAAVLRDARGRATAAHAALSRLVEIRNRVAHDDGGIVPTREDAALRLDEATPALRTLVSALRTVAHLPIGCVEACEADAWGRPVAHVLWFVGAEGVRTTQPLDGWGLPPRSAFVRDPDGRLHPLPPLAVAGVFERRGETDLRLLWRVRRDCPEYSAPGAHAPAPPLDPTPALIEARWGAAGAWATAEAPRLETRLPAPPSLAPDVPPRVGPYRVESRIAAGGSGAVFAARSAEGELVALKVLANTAQPSASMRARFEREAIILARLRHPAVVRVLRSGFDAAAGAWLALEYVDGRDLAALYADRRAQRDEAIDVARQLLTCLADVHAQGIVHRDVKPSNVLIDGRRRVRLVDFGIARDAGAATLTSALDALGTLAYAAPEQLNGGPVDGRTDLFGVGRLLGWLLTGQPGGRPAGLPGLAAFVRRLTARERTDRFASAAEALAAIDALGSGGAPVAPGLRLAGGYRVERVDPEPEDGVWGATAVELATGLTVGLAVAVAGSAGADVLTGSARLASADAGRRAETGYRALLEDDGLALLVADIEGVTPLLDSTRSDTAIQPVVAAPATGAHPRVAAAGDRLDPPATLGPEGALLALPHVARVDVETQTLGVRDFVGRTSGGQALAIARGVPSLPTGNPVHDPTVVRLASRCVSLLAHLVGVTDGRRWIWLRRLGARQLVVVDDPADALLRALGKR